MARLTNADRDRLRAQLLAALVPSQADAIAKLAEAAADAVFTEYYSAKTLKLFAAMPDEYWKDGVDYLYVEPTGKGTRGMHLRVKRRVPRAPDPKSFRPPAHAQAAIDAWANAQDEAARAHKAAEYQVNAVLARATTLESLLSLLPAARDILKLPAAEASEDTAAKLNAALAAQQPATPPAPQRAAKPPAAKPKPKAKRPA